MLAAKYEVNVTTNNGVMAYYCKNTTVYTHVNGDRPSHIENSKNKKSYITI